FVFESGLHVLPQTEALLRLLGAYAFGALGMAVVASFAFALSTMVDHSIWAIGGAMLYLIASGILGLIPYFENLRPYLFTTHLSAWRLFFAVPIEWGEITSACAWLAAHVILFFLAALTLFSRKDILS
ncbi:MAG: hypothetical protein QHJ73_15475, partial [Armatimonadota bacterium]|nr:hypothetical protein [Armatimonadota bacterium]